MIHTGNKCTTFTYLNRHENQCSLGVYAVIMDCKNIFISQNYYITQWLVCFEACFNSFYVKLNTSNKFELKALG